MHQTLKVEVREDGRIEILSPEFKSGQIVRVIVDDAPANPGLRPLGLLKGKVQIHENFDDPLEEFEPYK